MSNLNTQIKEQAAPGVLEVVAWALLVHEDTMKIARGDLKLDLLSVGRYTLSEREEARKILLEYGAGKPARIVEHRGSKKHPLSFETTVVPTRLQLTEPATIDAEIIE